MMNSLLVLMLASCMVVVMPVVVIECILIPVCYVVVHSL